MAQVSRASPNPTQELSDSELRFRTLFEQAPFSVQMLAADGRTLQVNKAWEALWQVDDDGELKRWILSEYNVLTDPQLQAKGITPLLQRAFAGEPVEFPVIRYDPAETGKPGRARWVKARAHPIKDPTGAVREVMLIHEDVTERMETESALRASELRLKELANTIPQLAWMADAQGFIHWYNDRWYEYTATQPAEMEGWGWQKVHHPQTLPAVLERWQASLASGEPFQMTFPLRGADGVFRPFFTLVAPLKDAAGKVTQWFGTNTDVSALHEAETELRRAEQRLRLAVDAGGIGIWDWDVAQNRVSWSDRVYELHGLAEGEFGGRAEDFARLIHPQDQDFMAHEINDALRDGDGFSAEFRIVVPGGESRWLSTWARVHRNDQGQPDRMVGATISVDAYKKAEAALREGDRRKDEFLAMLAHELRNPLAPISTAAQLLKLAGDDPARVQRASDIISRQVRHMTELVDDLLDVSRVTRGLIHLKTEPVDLGAVVVNAIEQVRPLLDASRHQVTTELDDGQFKVLGDRTRLTQVLVNLLHNASKYTPPGGRISVGLRTDRDRVAISVADNGSGIDAALLPHVFELFTQATRTPDRSQGGLGIGLALVRSIVALHGGEVAARSDGAGRGSAFTVTLPLPEAADLASSRPPAEPAPARRESALQILVVDDNQDAAQSLASLLELCGHQVWAVNDAQAALAQAGRARPQVFILDIGLPDMNGYELAQRLRSDPVNAKALFIALTGYGQEHDREQARAAGFDHHFVKPVETERLLETLARHG